MVPLALEDAEKVVPKESYTQELSEFNPMQRLREGKNAKQKNEQAAKVLEESLYKYVTMPTEQLQEVFCSCTTTGLASDDVRQHQIRYGPNRLREAKPKSASPSYTYPSCSPSTR